MVEEKAFDIRHTKRDFPVNSKQRSSQGTEVPMCDELEGREKVIN